MAYVMSIFGLIAVAAGGALTGFVVYSGAATPIVMLPGLSILGSGLIFMAIGAALFRLAEIHQQAQRMAASIDRIAYDISRR